MIKYILGTFLALGLIAFFFWPEKNNHNIDKNITEIHENQPEITDNNIVSVETHTLATKSFIPNEKTDTNSHTPNERIDTTSQEKAVDVSSSKSIEKMSLFKNENGTFVIRQGSLKQLSEEDFLNAIDVLEVNYSETGKENASNYGQVFYENEEAFGGYLSKIGCAEHLCFAKVELHPEKSLQDFENTVFQSTSLDSKAITFVAFDSDINNVSYGIVFSASEDVISISTL